MAPVLQTEHSWQPGWPYVKNPGIGAIPAGQRAGYRLAAMRDGWPPCVVAPGPPVDLRLASMSDVPDCAIIKKKEEKWRRF